MNNLFLFGEIVFLKKKQDTLSYRLQGNDHVMMVFEAHLLAFQKSFRKQPKVCL